MQNRPAVIVLTTKAHLFQMMQQSSFVDFLMDPEYFIYILELYPHSSWNSQPFESLRGQKIFPIYFTSLIKEYGDKLGNALQDFFEEGSREIEDWLYALAQKILMLQKQTRLGLSYAPALNIYFSKKRWFDLHKGIASSKRDLGPTVPDPMALVLKNRALVQRGPVKDRLVIAHVVPQILSGGHAPSRLLQNLIVHHNAQQFRPLVISTELHKEHPLEYP